MSEFKDYPTMLEEKKINAKKKRDEVKRLRDEASFKERQERYKKFEENSEIIENVRKHFTAKQIANKEYIRKQYHDEEMGDKITRYHEDDEIGIIEHKLNLMGNLLDGFGARIDMLEGKPPYPYLKVLMHK
jgi:hypothetical protein